MIEMLMKKYALSRQGAKEFIISAIITTVQYISFMFPVGIIFAFVKDITEGSIDKSRVPFYIVSSLAILVVLYVVIYFQYNSAYFATYKESGVRRTNLAENLRKLPLSFFGKRDLTDLTTVIMADCETLEKSFSHVMPNFVASIISTVLIAVCLFFFNVKLAVATLWPLPVSLIIVLTSKKVQMFFNERFMETKLELANGIQEAIDCSKDLKSYNSEEEYMTSLKKVLNVAEKRAASSDFAGATFVMLGQMILKFGIATVALVGSKLLINGEIDMLTLLMFLIGASRIYEPMGATLSNLSAINYMQVSVDRMNEIIESEPQLGITNFEPKNYDIRFKNVGFSYDDGESVLSDVSFTAKQGEVTALVGPSGGGKTTVSRLAARFYDVTKGKVLLGGVDVSSIDPEVLLKNYSIVFQDVTLFNNTIMENIRLGRESATDEEVIAAAKLANVDEFAMKLEKGYDTEIGENGCELSGGERQRISIARAFLKNAPIILLDEATASLDVENESLIQDALSKLIVNKTVMVIAHRMRTVAGADKVVVLADGVVAEEGTPEKLMNKNGIFAKMTKLQTESGNWSICN